MAMEECDQLGSGRWARSGHIRLPASGLQPIGSLVQALERVSADVDGGLDRGMAKPLLDHPRMLALGDQQGGAARSQVAEPAQLASVVGDGWLSHLASQRAPVDRSALRGSEHEAAGGGLAGSLAGAQCDGDAPQPAPAVAVLPGRRRRGRPLTSSPPAGQPPMPAHQRASRGLGQGQSGPGRRPPRGRHHLLAAGHPPSVNRNRGCSPSPTPSAMTTPVASRTPSLR